MVDVLKFFNTFLFLFSNETLVLGGYNRQNACLFENSYSLFTRKLTDIGVGHVDKLLAVKGETRSWVKSLSIS